ncbi:glycoside hydrolase family 2 TIM barrel-domain containing protein [Konateibacter massiliensis]|uniref:glycoside hydrolase family 2 TIM barrel-domain containing protein n=1 Tax=Konateibacter massiliensis TaxID=2002841 RepID=UPI000C15DFE0|nr:glycoside hydrolase family 2 TIM barrel-domain containing protein [Konateibacter massiliensis]
MKRIDFNENWTYKHLGDTTIGKAVTIPHDAMLFEKRSAKSAGGINTGWFEGYDYAYEKEFHVPFDYQNKNIVFEFEGVYRNAEVYLNGEKAAFRPYGYTNFYIEANSFLKYGEVNQIQVIARNADQPNSRWYSGAGIYRPVWMHVAEKEHILLNGVKIHTVSAHPAIIEVSVETTGKGPVRIEIPEADVKAEQEANRKAVFQLEIPDGKLWSVANPNLYTCKVTYKDDTVTETFGIRSLEWNAKKGLLINGKREILRGACIHHDNGVLGACCYAEAEERKIRILKENGYNAIRSAHNPCSKALLDACDRLGMLVMDEFVDVWYIHKTEYDYVNYFAEWWQQDLKDMVEKDYNHPSVILYSTGNEVSETAEERGIKLTGDMTAYLHSLDSTRPVTCGINIFFNLLSSLGFGVYSDKKAKKEVKRAEGKKKKAVGSEFFNNLAGIFGSNTMKLGATLHGCDVKTRDAFANMDIAGYNYGIFRYIKDLKKYPKRLILGTETFCSDAYDFWEMAKKHPRIIGDFVWAGMDYLGEVGVGSWEYKDYAPEFDHQVDWMTAGSGRIDITGKPLAEAAYTRTAFELTDKPIIAVRPVNHTNEKHSPSAWKMTNAIESWSWRGCEGKKATVEVYARAAKIELLINQKKVGVKTLKNGCQAIFHTTYHNGTVTAVAYDENDKEISRAELVTAEKKTVLRAIPEKDVLEAGKLSYIRLKYMDESGTVKPLMRGSLKVSVENGSLLGLGNGCPYNKNGYVTDKTDTYFGEALAVVRPNESGEFTLKVTDGKNSHVWKSMIKERKDAENQ